MLKSVNFYSRYDR